MVLVGGNKSQGRFDDGNLVNVVKSSEKGLKFCISTLIMQTQKKSSQWLSTSLQKVLGQLPKKVALILNGLGGIPILINAQHKKRFSVLHNINSKKKRSSSLPSKCNKGNSKERKD